MEDRLAQLFMENAYLDDDGWVLFASALYGVDVDVLLDVLAGRVPTTALSASAALAVLERFGADRLRVDGEERNMVLDAVDDDRHRDEMTLDVTLRLLAEEVACVAAPTRPRTVLELNTALEAVAAPADQVPVILGRVAAGRLSFPDMACPHTPDQQLDMAGIVLGALPTSADVAEFVNGVEPADRHVFAVAAAIGPWQGGDSGTCDVSWFDVVRWVVAHIDRDVDTPWGSAEKSEVRKTVAVRFLGEHPELVGPGALSDALWQVGDRGDLSANETSTLIGLGVAARLTFADRGDTLAAQICSLLSERCDGGTRPAPLPVLHLSTLPPMPASVVVCVAPEPVSDSDRTDLFQRLAQCAAGEFGQRWDPDELDAALDLRPGFRDGIGAVALNAGVGLDRSPRCVVEAAMRTAGLAACVSRSRMVRDELCVAAAGIGLPAWSVLGGLLEGFSGTPAELVAVAVEVAPAG